MRNFDRDTMVAALAALNDHLREAGVAGDLCVFGGATMVLAFNARLSTEDLDAVFQPADIIRQAAREVADQFDLKQDWLNDGVKGWISPLGKTTSENLPQFDHLRISRPTSSYLLAMKCLAARSAGLDTQGDKRDIIFLVQELRLRSSAEVLSVVQQYYEERLIQPKTRFLVEEIMSELAVSME